MRQDMSACMCMCVAEFKYISVIFKLKIDSSNNCWINAFNLNVIAGKVSLKK